ncbi:winged helix-turn-helix domain-containing protein [Candidatus Peregrinibacteria bacterium]|nr:winged helix-turn-helix domain-containing protein [Candidatus Peregrinibacteria bacterium]
MFVLVLTDTTAHSKFLSRGLKYENIHSNVKIFNDLWFNPYECPSYSAVICRMTRQTILEETLIKNINDISKQCPVFILDETSSAENVFKSPKNNIFIFTKDLPLRKLAFLIKKLVNTNNIGKQNMLKVCDLELDPRTRKVERFGEKHFLRNKEYQLLEYLMSNTDQILSRQKILETVWDRNANLFTNTIDTHIHNLRKKIDYKEKEQLIETVHCSGYIMHSNPKIVN